MQEIVYWVLQSPD